MLMNAGETEKLFEYIELKKEKGLYKWWAEYMES